MSSYTSLAGDTFESISRKIYGDEDHAGLVRFANPGVESPIGAGTVLVIPDLSLRQRRPTPLQPQDNDQGALALLIDGQRFRFWSSASISLSLDSFSIVEFRAPFDPDSVSQRATFRPFMFQLVEVMLGDQIIFRGHVVNISPSVDASSRTVLVTCYAAPGVLNDCTAPASLFPLEFKQADLRVIADRMIMPFGLQTRFDTDPGATFRIVRCDPQQRVYDFLISLAKQRNIVIGNTPAGELLFSRVVQGSAQPAAVLREGGSPVLSVSSAFNAQEYYSHITGIAPIALARIGSQYTARNPRLQTTIRPLIFNAKDSIDANIPEATNNKLSRMFGNMASYTITVDTWLDSSGSLWAPNTMISLQAPGAMIYRPYSFLLRRVTFNQDASSRTATLNLVLPGAFGGEIPEVLPWD